LFEKKYSLPSGYSLRAGCVGNLYEATYGFSLADVSALRSTRRDCDDWLASDTRRCSMQPSGQNTIFAGHFAFHKCQRKAKPVSDRQLLASALASATLRAAVNFAHKHSPSGRDGDITASIVILLLESTKPANLRIKSF